MIEMVFDISVSSLSYAVICPFPILNFVTFFSSHGAIPLACHSHNLQ